MNFCKKTILFLVMTSICALGSMAYAAEKTVVVPEKAPKAVGPYSQGIVSNNMVFVSGQLPLDPATNTMPEGIEAQAKQSLENVKAVLEAAGSSMDNVVKVTIFMKDLNDFGKVNDIYATYFTKDHPARATVQVARLPKDALVEIDAIAVK